MSFDTLLKQAQIKHDALVASGKFKEKKYKETKYSICLFPSYLGTPWNTNNNFLAKLFVFVRNMISMGVVELYTNDNKETWAFQGRTCKLYDQDMVPMCRGICAGCENEIKQEIWATPITK